VKQFADDCLITGPSFTVTNPELYAAFTAWWEANRGGKVMSQLRLGHRMTDMGYPSSTSIAGGTKRGQIGVGLLN
jgi:phage/plasmid-associated DNA primase